MTPRQSYRELKPAVGRRNRYATLILILPVPPDISARRVVPYGLNLEAALAPLPSGILYTARMNEWLSSVGGMQFERSLVGLMQSDVGAPVRSTCIGGEHMVDRRINALELEEGVCSLGGHLVLAAGSVGSVAEQYDLASDATNEARMDSISNHSS